MGSLIKAIVVTTAVAAVTTGLSAGYLIRGYVESRRKKSKV